ncbi:MAG: hypoxanthine phosphoribosyltransferase [Desulfovibrionaceae bacterium]|nr:hypoxanthine phosphoribosyltransferase [Desulfovibrionaceae bacterium]
MTAKGRDELTLCFSPEEIEARVSILAQELNSKLANERVVAVCVLRGAVLFFADLVRKLSIPNLVFDFCTLSSYGDKDVSSGEVSVRTWLSQDISDAHVLIVEDIVDTGRSMQTFLARLALCPQKGITLCALLDKSESRVCAVPIDYACFQVKAGFYVGYGLDFAQRYRHLPGIYTLHQN